MEKGLDKKKTMSEKFSKGLKKLAKKKKKEIETLVMPTPQQSDNASDSEGKKSLRNK